MPGVIDDFQKRLSQANDRHALTMLVSEIKEYMATPRFTALPQKEKDAVEDVLVEAMNKMELSAHFCCGGT